MVRSALLACSFILLASFLSLQSAFATHVAGAQIAYEHLTGNQYTVRLQVFFDCNSINTYGTTIPVCVANSCGTQFIVNLTAITPVIYPNQFCPSTTLQTNCTGGSVSGIFYRIFEGTASLPPLTGGCTGYTLSYDNCCRAQSVNILNPLGQNFRIQSRIEIPASNSNSSPVFRDDPVYYYCQNQVSHISNYVGEDDGDSLVYSFAAPNGASGSCNQYSPLAFTPGFSQNTPIDGATIDSSTGKITFGPVAVAGHYVLVVRVDEYDQQGQHKGWVARDLKIIIDPCFSNPNTPQHDTASSVATGNGTLVDPMTVGVCAGQSFCFSTDFYDNDLSDTLTASQTIANSLPGASVTFSGTNPLTMTVCWTAPGNANSIYNYSLDVADNGCPIIAISGFSFSVQVSNSTYAGPDVTICAGESHAFNASGIPNFSWSSIAGDPLIPGTNISCTACPDPVVSPSQTTTYVVQSGAATGCPTTDTVTVTVIPNTLPPYNFVWQDSLLCQGDTGLLTTDLINPLSYGYSWSSSPGLTLLNNNQPVLELVSTGPGPHEIYLTLNDSFCYRVDTISFDHDFDFGPFPDVYLCPGDTMTYTVAVPQTVSVKWTPNFWVTDPNAAVTNIYPPSNQYYDLILKRGVCKDTVPLQVWVDDTVCVHGWMTTDSGSVLDSSMVYLYQLDTNFQVTFIDSVMTDSSGYYEICTTDTSFYLGVQPDTAQHPGQMTTFYPGEFLIQNATPLISNCGWLSVSLSTFAGQSNSIYLGGIGGQVVLGGSNKRTTAGIGVPGVRLFLVDDQELPVAYTETDDQGYFFADGLAPGTYHVFVEDWGFDNVDRPTVTLSENRPVRDNLVLYLWDDWLEYGSPLSVDEAPLGHRLRAYPNPTSAVINLQWEGVAARSFDSWELVDLIGKRLQGGGSLTLFPNQPTPLNIHQAEGVYFLRLHSGSDQHVIRLLIVQ